MKTTKRLLLPLIVLGSLLATAPAHAAYTVGIGDQSAGMFANQLWKDLRLKKVRYVVPYDQIKSREKTVVIDQYMTAARAAKQEVLVHFTARRGCFDGKYSKSRACRIPSVAAYTKNFRAFKKRYPYVKTYGAWNEANHVSQPTFKNPRRAAQYYTALKRYCKGCKVVAGDLLDSSNLRSYASAMNRALKGRAKLWGLHNYADVNRNRSSGTTTLLKTVPGEVWMTETGGIVNFDAARGFNPSENAASTALKRMFSLANKYDSRRRGYKSRITRLYPYNFQEQENARFDAGLLAPNGSPRKGYATFKAGVRRAKR